MMRHFFFISPIMALVCSLSAAEAPVIRWHEPETETVAVRTGSVTRLRDSRKTVEENNFAGRAGSPGIYYMWQPSRDNSRATGGAALLDCRMSHDGSALLLLEQLGESGGALGARIIVLNIAQGRVVAAPEFLRNRIIAILPLKRSDTAILALEAQKDEKFRLLMIDISSGTIISASPAFACRPEAGMVLHGKRLFMVSGDGRGLISFVPERLGRPVDAADSEVPVRMLLDGGKSLILVSDGKVRYADFAAGTLRIDEDCEAALPKDFAPSFGAVMPGEKTLLLGVPGGECFIVAGDTARKVLDGCGRTAAWIPAVDAFALNLLLSDIVEFLSPPDFAVSGSKLKPGRLRPVTRGDVLRIFPAPDKRKTAVFIVDHRANLFLLERRNGRSLWRKQMIFEPQADE